MFQLQRLAWYAKKKFSTISVLSPSFLESKINPLLLNAESQNINLLWSVIDVRFVLGLYPGIASLPLTSHQGLKILAHSLDTRILQITWFGLLSDLLVWKNFSIFWQEQERNPRHIRPDLDLAGSERLFAQKTLSIQSGNTPFFHWSSVPLRQTNTIIPLFYVWLFLFHGTSWKTCQEIWLLLPIKSI